MISKLGSANCTGDALFELAPPKLGIGVDQIPDVIRRSTILTGNNLGQLGSCILLSTFNALNVARKSPHVSTWSRI